jgi:malonyl-CoA O-methyltransferase
MDKYQTIFDKQHVRNNFERAAESYDKAAVLQREVAGRLLERLDYVLIQPETVLDVGAGTGYVSQGLASRYKQASTIEMDLSVNMLVQGRKNIPWYRRPFSKKLLLCGDAEHLPLASESIDLLISSLTIQWCNDLQQTFTEFRRVLKPGGLLMFTTFGPDTLKELRQSWASVDQQGHVSPFLDMHDIGDTLLSAGMAEPVMDVEHFTLTYPDVAALVKDLKDIGATNTLQQRARGLTGKRAYQAMVQAYETLRVDGTLPASYEVIYGHAWKGQGGNESIHPQREIPVL